MSNSIFDNIKFLIFLGILGSAIIAIGMAFSNSAIAGFGGLILAIVVIFLIIGVIIEVKG